MIHFIPAGMEWVISFLPEWNGPFHSGRNGIGHFIPAEWEHFIEKTEQSKHRESGKSILGRPLKEKSKKLQLQVLENEEFLSYSLTSLKTKPKKPHNLSASVASNCAGEKKH